LHFALLTAVLATLLDGPDTPQKLYNYNESTTNPRQTEPLRTLVKLEFHGADTDMDIDTDIDILADLSADLSDTRAFPREDLCEDVR